MKQYVKASCLGLLALTCGCATDYLADKAKPQVEFDQQKKQNIQVPGHTAYYALLPLSIPLDVVTLPIQVGVLLAWPAARTPTTNAPAKL